MRQPAREERLLKPFENYNDEAPLASLEVSIAAIASVISEPAVMGGRCFFSSLNCNCQELDLPTSYL